MLWRLIFLKNSTHCSILCVWIFNLFEFFTQVSVLHNDSRMFLHLRKGLGEALIQGEQTSATSHFSPDPTEESKFTAFYFVTFEFPLFTSPHPASLK